jgi:LysM repeat protein
MLYVNTFIMLRYLLLLFVLVSCFTGSYGFGVFTPGDSIGEKVIDGKKHILYQVAQGETLYRISTTYQVPVAELIEINPELETGLKNGQILFIPYRQETVASTEPKAAPAHALDNSPAKNQPSVAEVSPAVKQPSFNDSIVHVVQPGETLYGLSRKYGVSIEELKQWNNWELKAGQELIIRPSVNNPVITDAKTHQAVTATPVTKPAISGQQQAYREPVVTKAEPAKPVVESKTVAEPAAELVKPAVEQVKPVAEPAKTAAVAVKPTPDPVVKESRAVIVRSDPQQVTHDSIKLHNSVSYLDDRDDLINGTRRVLVVPFDPYMYFSDADEEIANRSKMPRNRIREVFRRRLNVLIDPKGYEPIYLLGASEKDSLQDLQRIYQSVSYNYQDIVYSNGLRQKEGAGSNGIEVGAPPQKSWFERQKGKFVSVQNNTKPKSAKDQSKYFGAKINDPKVIDYFNHKYGIDYYIFVNQFEVKTNYEHCLDRAAQDYERNFITHFSIFNGEGKLIAGNKVKIFYNSNSNSIFQIVNDNMQKIADAILSELPR